MNRPYPALSLRSARFAGAHTPNSFRVSQRLPDIEFFKVKHTSLISHSTFNHQPSTLHPAVLN
jgi:hypothetical protein